MAGNTQKIAFGTGAGFPRHRRTSSGKARRAREAFAELSAAIATLTGAAMTAKTITRAVTVPVTTPPCRSAKVRTVCSSCPVGCEIVAEINGGVWNGRHSGRGKPSRKFASGLVYALPRPALPVHLSTAPSTSGGDQRRDRERDSLPGKRLG